MMVLVVLPKVEERCELIIFFSVLASCPPLYVKQQGNPVHMLSTCLGSLYNCYPHKTSCDYKDFHAVSNLMQ